MLSGFLGFTGDAGQRGDELADAFDAVSGCFEVAAEDEFMVGLHLGARAFGLQELREARRVGEVVVAEA